MTTYSANLKLTLLAFGEAIDSWGDIANSNMGTLLEQSIVGNGAVAMSDGTTTIAIADGSTSPARCYYLTLSGALTAQRDLVVPTINKPYIVTNNTTGGFGVNVRTSGGLGVVVPNGQRRLVYANGTDVIEGFNSVGNLAVNGTLTPTGTVTITSGSINGVTIGNSSPSTGAFTTLSASSTVSGAGFTAYLASPPAIGGTAPAAGTFTTLIGTTISGAGSFTTLAASSTVSGAGIVALMASPGPIGSTSASTGSFTTLAASSTVSGTGFTNLFASPPAIGGTVAAAGAFTTLSASGAVSGAGFVTLHSSPGPIGNGTPSTGSFTTLSASSTVSGVGFTSFLASPPAIGGTLAAGGAFTTLSASSTVSGAGFVTLHSSPGPIGNGTPSTGAFTTLSASSTVSGAGFSTYLASPPAIGGTVAAAGAFTTLSASSTVSGAGFSTYLASPPAIGLTAPAEGKFVNLTATGSISGSSTIGVPTATFTVCNSSSFLGPLNGTVGGSTPTTGAFTTVTCSTSITPVQIAGSVYNSGTNRFGQNSTDSPGVSNTTAGSALPTSGQGYFSYNGSALNVNRNSDGTIATFYRSGNSPGGGIDITTTTLAFTAVSDYRKKKNWKPMVKALQRVNLLNPIDFQWLLNDEWAEGFLAHELQAVVPGAVFGEKDDDTRFQAVDPGKIVPLLVAALKELSAEVETLKARLA